MVNVPKIAAKMLFNRDHEQSESAALAIFFVLQHFQELGDEDFRLIQAKGGLIKSESDAIFTFNVEDEQAIQMLTMAVLRTIINQRVASRVCVHRIPEIILAQFLHVHCEAPVSSSCPSWALRAV